MTRRAAPGPGASVLGDDGRRSASGRRRRRGRLAARLGRKLPALVLLVLGVLVTQPGVARSATGTQAGPAYGWGDNVTGNVGDGTTVDRTSPAFLASLGERVVAISTGGSDGGQGSYGSFVLPSHTLALLSNGSVVAWGENNRGQLGDGTTQNRTSPVPVVGLGSGVIAIAAGTEHSLAVKADGTVLSWGANSGEGISSSNCDPSGLAGPLGVDPGTCDHLGVLERHVPGPVTGLGSGSGVVAVAASGSSLALASDGTFFSWGANGHGELGDGTFTTRWRPARVTPGARFTAIAAGSQFSLALSDTGQVWSWGYDDFGELGIPPPPPRAQINSADQPTPAFNGVIGAAAIAAGGYHGLALRRDGRVMAWGYNVYGELGTGVPPVPQGCDCEPPTPVFGLDGVTSIGAGGFHSLAGRADGTVYAWGDNVYAQLGDRTYTNRTTPVRVLGTPGNIRVVAGGWANSFAVSTVPPTIPGGVPPPTVDLLDPSSGPTAGGTAVAVEGTGLAAVTTVSFGSSAITTTPCPAGGGTGATPCFTVASDSHIDLYDPAHAAGQVDVTVRAPSGTSARTAADLFTYVPPGSGGNPPPGPTVTGIDPSSGPVAGGTKVTISGTRLAGTTVVRFGRALVTASCGAAKGTGTSPCFSADSDTRVTAYSPEVAGPITVHVTVLTPDGASRATAADLYDYLDVALSVSPQIGPVTPGLGSGTLGGEPPPVVPTGPGGAPGVNLSPAGASTTAPAPLAGTAPGSALGAAPGGAAGTAPGGALGAAPGGLVSAAGAPAPLPGFGIGDLPGEAGQGAPRHAMVGLPESDAAAAAGGVGLLVLFCAGVVRAGEEDRRRRPAEAQARARGGEGPRGWDGGDGGDGRDGADWEGDS